MVESLDVGRQIGNYRIVRILGQGGMGAVYEVEHVNLGTHYGLKTYTLDEGEHVELFRKRFAAEGKILSRLNHPGLVRVFDLDYDEATGVFYYVMDLVLYKDGNAYTLADLEPGGADEDQIYDWFKETCEALSYVHSHGIVHRDIKLNNLLLSDERHAILSDFGISRIFDDDLRSEVNVSMTMVSGDQTTGRLVMGTAGYMAPEILRGEVATVASDAYALGVVFFKLLTGIWYDPSMSPMSDTSTGVDAFQLLNRFEYDWKPVLMEMLDAEKSKRPLDLSVLPARVVKKHPSGTAGRLKWIGIAASVLAVAAAVVFLVVKKTDSGSIEADAGQSEEVSVDDAFAVPESLK